MVTTVADDLDRLRQRIETTAEAVTHLAGAGHELANRIDELNERTKQQGAQIAKIHEELHVLWEHVTAAGGDNDG